MSLGLNLLLLLILGAAWMRRLEPGVGVDSNSGGSRLATHTTPSRQAASPVGERSNAPRSHETIWSRLQSSDPLAFAANLRKVGCPEQTVCDLVHPVVDRWFERRREEIGKQDPFWASGRARVAVRERYQAALHALADEKLAMVRTLTCGFELREAERDLISLGLADLFSGFLGPAKQQDLLQLMLEWRERGEIVGWDAATSRLSGDPRRARAASEEIRSRLDQILTRKEREELDRRIALISFFPDDAEAELLQRLKLSIAEAKEFVRIRTQSKGSTLEELLRLEERGGSPRSTEGDTGPALEALLGPDRYAMFQKFSDPAFRSVDEAAQTAKVPTEIAEQSYAIITGFAPELSAIRSAWESNPDVARPTLQAWRAAQRSRLDALLTGLPEATRKALSLQLVDEAIRNAWRKR